MNNEPVESPTKQIVDRLFFDAIELPQDKRDDFLKSQSNDPAVVEEVQALLYWHGKDDGTEAFILDQPVALESESSKHAIGEQVGDEIGSFRLLEKIGEGGMGVVYMAEQRGGIRRKVALKIIKPGMDTRQIVARFEAERQAMAIFDYPGIAKVYDAGATQSGRPYFAMELVRGSDLVTYCTAHRLSLQQRLELFEDVCEAVQHAHHKGIIHRDLKPSNVMVTLIDSQPVVKVIDFGIAKAIGGQSLTDKTLFTRYGCMLGTPENMSPEQAQMSGQDVDTRSDIYSLGVLLYKLITGTTPLKKEKLRTLNPMALSETISNANIETPSSRLTSVKPTDKQPNGANVASLRIRKELDWIVMKALARERDQRYVSANDFRLDVRRFLNGEPVTAMPPSRINNAMFWLRRNRVPIAIATLISMLLAGWAITASVINQRLTDKTQELTIALKENGQNLERALDAEQEQRVAKNKLKFGISHEIVFTKFSERYHQRYRDKLNAITQRIRSNNLADVHNDEERKAVEAVLEELRTQRKDIPDQFNVCRGLDANEWKRMLLIPGFESVDLPTEKLKNHIDSWKVDVVEKMVAYDGLPNLSHSVHECGEICQIYKNEMRSVYPEARIMLFQLLVEEYRRSFPSDPVIEEAQLLHAASLIAAGKKLESKELLNSLQFSSQRNNDLLKQLLQRAYVKE